METYGFFFTYNIRSNIPIEQVKKFSFTSNFTYNKL